MLSLHSGPRDQRGTQSPAHGVHTSPPHTSTLQEEQQAARAESGRSQAGVEEAARKVTAAEKALSVADARARDLTDRVKTLRSQV